MTPATDEQEPRPKRRRYKAVLVVSEQPTYLTLLSALENAITAALDLDDEALQDINEALVEGHRKVNRELRRRQRQP
jgi:hypothetical protein